MNINGPLPELIFFISALESPFIFDISRRTLSRIIVPCGISSLLILLEKLIADCSQRLFASGLIVTLSVTGFPLTLSIRSSGIPFLLASAFANSSLNVPVFLTDLLIALPPDIS